MRFFVILILLCTRLVEAQPVRWFSGAIVLDSGKVLCGTMSVNQIHDMVLFQKAEKVDVYAAHKVQFVHFFDGKANVNRKFISVLQKQEASSKYLLYEIVLNGEMSVMRKASGPQIESDDEVHKFKYFILFRGEIYPLNKFRSTLYPLLAKSSESVVSYVKRNDLNINSPADIINVLKYCNREQLPQGLVRND